MKKIVNDYRFSKCPLCNSTLIKKIGDLDYKGQVEFSTHFISLAIVPEAWKCFQCGSSFTQNAIPPDVAEKLYESGEGSKRWSPKNFEEDKTEEVRKILRSYFGKNTSVLDIGCNTGEFLDFARIDEVKTAGLEFCIQSLDIIRSKGHTPFRASSEIKEKFDLITAFDVFEHVYDPNGFLEFVHSILNDNGKFIILTGNPGCLHAKLSRSKWWYYNYPEHVIFPSRKFFRQISGFRLEKSYNVFVSLAHDERGFFFMIKNLIKIIIDKNYSGRPALIPDHQLVILQKNKF